MINDISFVRRGVIIEDKYIVSDLHLGYSSEIDTMTKQDEKSHILQNIKDVLDMYKIDQLVIAGDLFHEFGKPSQNAQDILDFLLTRLEVAGCELVLIRGNHDQNVDDYIGNNVMREDYDFMFNQECITVVHGHKMWSDYEETDIFIMGHLHPVVKINGSEWPTYLYGSFEENSYLILPAYSRYQDGVVVSNRMKLDIQFPFIEKSDFSVFKPLVYDDNKMEIREFPKLEESSEYFGV